MTGNQSESVRDAVKVKVIAEKHPLEKIIEDPFSSMFAATVLTGLAVTAVLSGMWIVNIVLS